MTWRLAPAERRFACACRVPIPALPMGVGVVDVGGVLVSVGEGGVLVGVRVCHVRVKPGVGMEVVPVVVRVHVLVAKRGVGVLVVVAGGQREPEAPQHECQS